MIHLIRTDSNHNDFIELVKFLDADLAIRDGEDHSFYAQYNTLDQIKWAMILYENGKPIACGALKEYSSDTIEIKRMYTSPQHRGLGIASQVLLNLENWAKELSYKKCILETGHKQPEAIALYLKNGYAVIPNYGQYEHVENSLCFEKHL